MEKKKKILYLITQSELGGAQKYVLDLINGLRDDFEMFIGFGEKIKESELEKKLKPTGAVYYAIPHLKRKISPLHDLIALVEIIKIIRRIKPDIIHLNSTKISIVGSFAAIFTKAKIIYTAHGWVFNEPGRSGRFYKLAEKFTARFKDKIICVSEFDRETAIKEKIANEKKLITIHNGIEPINFLPRDNARQKLTSVITNIRIENSDFIIGSIGNLYKTKGYEYLIDAAKLLKDNGRKFKIIIIGEGRERQALEDWIAQNSLEKQVFLAGSIDNAAQILPGFNVYVSSSLKEGLSYTLIEAMQAGLAIVATRVGGNPELIKNEVTGLLVDSQDPSGLATAIAKLIKNPDLWSNLSTAAREKAKNEFSFEKMVQKTKQIYQNS